MATKNGSMGTMKAGAGRAQIEFPEGFLPFDGFGTTGAEEPLYARTVVIEDAQGARFAFCSVEATSLREPMLSNSLERIQQIAGVAPERAWLGVTHSFSVPHVRTDAHVKTERELVLNAAWRAAIEAAVSESTCQAVAGLVPAQLAYGEAACTINVNRDVETPEGWWHAAAGQRGEGYSDHVVRALAATAPGEGLIALICTFDVQSSLLDQVRDADGLKVVSGDVAGTACRIVEEGLAAKEARRASGKQPVCLFAVGAAADQMPEEGAGAGMAALPRASAELAAAIQEAAAAAGSLAPGPVRATAFDLQLAGQKMPANMRDLHPTRSYERVPAPANTTSVHVSSIAGVPLVGVAPEVSSLMAARIRATARSPRALVFTMINGAQKYLVEAEAYDRNTYESMNSGFAQGGAEALVEAAAAQITRMQSPGIGAPATQPDEPVNQPQKEA